MSDRKSFFRKLEFAAAQVNLVESDSKGGQLYFALWGDYTAKAFLNINEVEQLSVALKEYLRTKNYGPCKLEASQPTCSASCTGNQRHTYVEAKPSAAGRGGAVDGPSLIGGEKKEADSVESPSHYRAGKVECVDALDSATVGLTGEEGFHVANVIKYVWRWKFKNGLEDLKKARWYLDRLIRKVEK